ncbi:malate dehydrogenase [Stemphylium lycopersici]|uniref:malate dehydrogenase n=1 Tax=Stemphylium lycopersici TaxID=183478 RepID=A0A364NA38_STELY|nr:malate dehydrogenase [Stemphylium lycopersici]RAR14185.1 malate dehydrogenase [Stemphylium lycopersici]
MDQVNLQGHGQQKMRQATAAPRKYDGQQGNPLYDSANGGHYGASAAIAAQNQAPDPQLFTGSWQNVNQGLTGNYRDILNTYWQQQVTKLETDEHDYKLHQLPLARIKKVMKADPEVKMISAEAPILFAKGCDIFITELTMRAWIHAEENKRRTLQRSDIASALSKSDMFDFLIDIVPREEAHPHKRSAGQNAAVQSSAAVVPPGGMPQPVHAQHPMAPPDYGMNQHLAQQEDYRQPPMYPGPVQNDPSVYAQQQMFDPNAYGPYGAMGQQPQMYAVGQRGPDPSAGDPQGFGRYGEADPDDDAQGERRHECIRLSASYMSTSTVYCDVTTLRGYAHTWLFPTKLRLERTEARPRLVPVPRYWPVLHPTLLGPTEQARGAALTLLEATTLLSSSLTDSSTASSQTNPPRQIFPSSSNHVKMVKAVVAGASGGIGQPLSLLLKSCQQVDELALYDVVNTPGVAADLSHISTPAVRGFLPKDDGMKGALTGADIVVIPAGIPRKPGMTRDDLFKINAGIVQGLIEGVAKYCPKAFVLVISNPVNSTVPIAAEVLKKAGVFDPKKLFGVTTLDVVRAETFVAEITGEKNPGKLSIPVIGGHSGETIVPLFSQAKPSVNIPADKMDALVNRVQFGGDEVVKAKEGAGSATLSMAYAGYRFAEKVIKAAKGEKGIVEPSFVYLPGVEGGDAIAKATGTEFFSVPIELGPNGAEKAIDVVSSANEHEKKLLQACYDGLKGNISKGVEFVANPPAK